MAWLTLAVQFIICPPAWSDDRPSHPEAIAKIRTYLGSPGIMEVKNIKYENGYEQDHNHYVVAATYSIVFEKGFGEIITSGDKPVLDGKDTPEQKKALENYMLATTVLAMTLQMKYGRIHQGDAFDESCEFVFLRTENGWIIQKTNGDAAIVASHLNQAARQKEEQEEQEKQSAKAKLQTEAAQAAMHEYQVREEAVRQACASGQRLIIRGGPVKLDRLSGAGLLEQYVFNGQIVTPVANAATPSDKCHIEYTSGRNNISGDASLTNLDLVISSGSGPAAPTADVLKDRPGLSIHTLPAGRSTWKGQISSPDGRMNAAFSMTIVLAGDGTLSGQANNELTSATGAHINKSVKTTVIGSVVATHLHWKNYYGTYLSLESDGNLSADESTITGTWQAGASSGTFIARLQP